MSLIVGIRCNDGVALGAVELSSAPAHTQPPAQGVTFEISRDVVLAGSGRLGLGQRFAQVVSAVRADSRFNDWEPLRAARAICAEAVEDLQTTRSLPGQFAALVAFASAEGAQLCEFAAADLQPELKTPARPFACLGSWCAAGESFLRFVFSTLLAERPPVLAEAVFAVTWTLIAAGGIDSNTSPVLLRLAVLERESPEVSWTARRLTDEEVADQLGRVRAAGKHLAEFRERLEPS